MHAWDGVEGNIGIGGRLAEWRGIGRWDKFEGWERRLARGRGGHHFFHFCL